LGEKNHPRLRTLALMAGSLIVGLILAFLGFKLGTAAPVNEHQTLISAIIDLVFALIFIWLGLAALFPKKEKSGSIFHQQNPKAQLWKWLGIGFIISATNFDAALLNFTAVKEIGSSEFNLAVKLILIIIGLLFFIAPILIPFVFNLLLPHKSKEILEPINNFIRKYSRYIVAIIFIVFAILLLYRGLKYFV